MLYKEFNDGRTQNLLHISEISQDGTDIVYKPAKGSLADYREHFETEAEAANEYNLLKKELLISSN